MPFEMITVVYICTVVLILAVGIVFLCYYSKTHKGEDEALRAGKLKYCKNEYGDVVRPSELNKKAKLTMEKTVYYLDPAPRRITAYVEEGKAADGASVRLVVDFMAYVPADFVDMAAAHVFGMNDEAIDELLEELSSNALAESVEKLDGITEGDETKLEVQKIIQAAVYPFGYSAGKIENLKIIR